MQVLGYLWPYCLWGLLVCPPFVSYAFLVYLISPDLGLPQKNGIYSGDAVRNQLNYLSTTHTEWGLSVCFLALFISFYTLEYFRRNEIFIEENEIYYKLWKYWIIFFLFLTAKYPLFVLTGMIRNTGVTFWFHLVDVFIISAVLVAQLPFLIYYYMSMKRPFFRRLHSEEKEARLVLWVLMCIVIGFINVVWSVEAVGNYSRYRNGELRVPTMIPVPRY